MTLYNSDFYHNIRDGSRRSAEEIVPLIVELLHPHSVVDVGCGVGTWLATFTKYGIEDVFGVDGSYVNTHLLEIPAQRFASFDLTQPLRMERQFDLVMSLEVAEHLPSAYGETFVESLISLGPVVLFSAAIPFQGGTHHVNEQWPDYWVECFHQYNYVAIDCLRKKIWHNEHIEWWYIQNILLFVDRNYLDTHPVLKNELAHTSASQLALVHPRKYLEVVDSLNRLVLTIQDIAGLIPSQDTFILVDQAQLGEVIAAGRRTIPFLEQNGHYWGPPPDDMTAIRELERLRQAEAQFIVFAWPAFWWLEYYGGFYSYLQSRFPCVLRNSRLIVFDVRTS